jgi:NADPH2:quinone reductase
MECVGEVLESARLPVGTLVYAEVRSSPATPGTFATEVVVADHAMIPVCGRPDPRAAVGVGNAGVAAFIPLIEQACLRENETVLVLGATGVVGQLAVQIAKAHGAARVVGVGRDEAALQRVRSLGADDTVRLEPGETADDLTPRLQAALADGGPNVVLDAIYGVALEAALRICAAHARIVNIGQFGGRTIELPAELLRARQLTISGFASFLTPLPAKQRALEWAWAALDSGRLDLKVVEYALDDLPLAWAAQATSPHAKNVITFATT